MGVEALVESLRTVGYRPRCLGGRSRSVPHHFLYLTHCVGSRNPTVSQVLYRVDEHLSAVLGRMSVFSARDLRRMIKFCGYATSR